MSDAVHHPAHYNAHPAGMECIDLVERLPFCQGNAIKYLWRADHKGARKQDLEKALWYVRRARNSRGAMVRCEFSGVDRAASGFSEAVGEIIREIASGSLRVAERQLQQLLQEGA